jgi:LmbE family N-acetylglucosaminyl deacetylase
VTGAAAISVLHLAPHPDDELIGAPATLIGLRHAGHRVFNLACSLGRPAHRARREAELGAAMELAHFEWEAVSPPLAISAGDDLALAQRRLAPLVRELIVREGFDLVVSPSPHDGHHGHEVVGRAAAEAIASLGTGAPPWWLWGLWADLALPTLFVPFDEDAMADVLRALAPHTGELARADYAAVVRGRALANRVLGIERAFGFGEPRVGGPYAHLRADGRPYAELLAEVLREGDAWQLAAPRTPEPTDPLAGARAELPVGWWIDEPSVQERARRLRASLTRA